MELAAAKSILKRPSITLDVYQEPQGEEEKPKSEYQHEMAPLVRIVDFDSDDPTEVAHEEKSRKTCRDNRRVSFKEDALLEKEENTVHLRSPLLKRRRDHAGVHLGWGKVRRTMHANHAITTLRKKRTKTKKGSGHLTREDSFIKRFSTRHQAPNAERDADKVADEDVESPTRVKQLQLCRHRLFKRLSGVMTSDSNFMCYWCTILTTAILYNLWLCIARESFPELQEEYQNLWFGLDGLSDFLYILDFIVQLRTGYLEQGIVVKDAKKLAKHYIQSKYFVLDVISIIPLDIVQVWTKSMHAMLRFPRFVKVYRAWTLYYVIESRTVYPNLWRVVNLIHILLLLAHWFAGFYYVISVSEDFKGRWTYPEPVGVFATLTRKYLACLYWSTLTLTTIGDLPPPESTDQEWERFPKNSDSMYIFTIVSYLIGVFVFATIVGQVGNIITNRNASRLEFERLLDGAKQYMRNHNVPMEMQRRVTRWYIYSWSRGRMTGGGDIHSLGLLPDKLKTELALHVNLNTLKKVTIFQECQPEFLHDLVLKMKAFIFTPGDCICRKGEVAREMFIIADGILEVIGEDGTVLRQMKAGDFFGEIGILNLDGANRRSADVRSVGYSELFSLSREDVLAAMKDYPEAEAIITEYGQRRLAEAKKHWKKPSAVTTTVNIVKDVVQMSPPVVKKAKQASLQNVVKKILMADGKKIKRKLAHSSSKSGDNNSVEKSDTTKGAILNKSNSLLPGHAVSQHNLMPSTIVGSSISAGTLEMHLLPLARRANHQETSEPSTGEKTEIGLDCTEIIDCTKLAMQTKLAEVKEKFDVTISSLESELQRKDKLIANLEKRLESLSKVDAVATLMIESHDV